MSTVMKKKVITSILIVVVYTIVTFASDTNSKPLDAEILDAACNHFLQYNQAYLTHTHKPLIILFSACAGMGKTTIAAELQKRLQLIKFDAWEARIFLRDRQYFDRNAPDEEKITRFVACFTYFLKQVKTMNNKAILFDESIDRQEPHPPLYDRIAKIAQEHDYPIFLIKIQVPKDIAFQRLQKREQHDKHTLAHLMERFESYYQAYSDFPGDRVDFILENEEEHQEKKDDILKIELINTLKDRIAYE